MECNKDIVVGLDEGYKRIFNDNPVVKTVYDPCPAGFHVPATNAFTGFTPTGESSNIPCVTGGWDDGWHFNNKQTNHDATLYFPAIPGYYGLLADPSYWSALAFRNYGGALANGWAACFKLRKEDVQPKSYTFEISTHAVRPVADE